MTGQKQELVSVFQKFKEQYKTKKLLHLEMDLKALDQLLDEIVGEPKGQDKPKQLLEAIILKLDSSPPNDMNAIYKFGTICITPSFLKEFLGPEVKVIRKEWLKRGYTVPVEQNGKEIDHKVVKSRVGNLRVIIVKREFIQNMGLDLKQKTGAPAAVHILSGD